MTSHWREPFEVAVATYRRPPGIKTHRLTSLTPADTTVQEGIPVTTPARTVLDCAPARDEHQLRRFVNNALNSLFLSERALTDVVARNPDHPGARRLQPHVVATAHGLTRSPLEDTFVDFIRRHGLPMPELNFPMNGRVLDAYYREERLIIELDGYNSHTHRPTFELDRDKDADAVAAGLATVRITETRMANTPDKEADRLQTILAARRRDVA